MTLLNDLDPLAWVALFAAIIVFCSVTFLNLRDWRNHWPVDFNGRLPIVLYLGIAFIVGACDSYSPDARAPRKMIEGTARFVTEITGKGGYSEYICATSCDLTGGYALKLHGKTATAVKIGSRYVFTYLEHPVGNAVTGISLRVIKASESDSGRTVYELDLANHPYRMAAYLFDLALLICSGFIGARLRSMQRRPGKMPSSSNEGFEHKHRAPPNDGPISLGLESKDGS